MTRDEWDALTPAAKCDLLEQRIAGDFFSESERDIVRDVVALARQNAHERDSAVERERLQRECVVCHADVEPDRVLVPHCNDCVVTDEHEWEWHDRLTQLEALGDADAPQSRADDPQSALCRRAAGEIDAALIELRAEVTPLEERAS